MAVFDAVTLAEAARILGTTSSTAQRRIAVAGIKTVGRYKHNGVSRADVEQLAMTVFFWRLHLEDVDPYWVTGDRAAAALGVNEQRLNQLASKGALPCLVHDDGTRLYRRAQLEVIGNARAARWPSARRRQVGAFG